MSDDCDMIIKRLYNQPGGEYLRKPKVDPTHKIYYLFLVFEVERTAEWCRRVCDKWEQKATARDGGGEKQS